MVVNANGPEMAGMLAYLDRPQPLNLSGISGISLNTAYFEMLISPFYKLNKTFGLWDFKQSMEALGGAVTLCGSGGCLWVDYSTPGNIHFGYIAAALAIPEQLSMAAGGYLELQSSTGQPGGVSTLFENPEDWAAVSFGYDLYNSFGNDMTLAEFKGALTADVGQSLQPPPSDFKIPGLAEPQENHYPIGYFNYK